MTESPRRMRWSHSTKVVVVVMIAALGAYLLYRFRVIVPPMVLAAILAYVVTPLVNAVQRRTRLPRVAATGVVYLVLLAVAVAAQLVLIPVLADQVEALNLDLRLLSRAVESLTRRAATSGWHTTLAPAIEQLDAAWRALTGSFLERTLALLLDVLSSAVWGVFILVVAFYLIKDGERVRGWMETLVPPDFLDDYRRLRDEINLVWAAFFRGQIVLALVVAALFTVVGFAIGLPFALALGLLAGLLEFLPSLGHGIWFVAGVGVALLQGSTWLPIPAWAFALLVAALHLVFQQVDLNLLIPRIIGGRVRLPPLVVILGIVAGAALAGVLGVALAAPVVASARILGRYVYANLLDLEPFAVGARADGTPDPTAAAPLTATSES